MNLRIGNQTACSAHSILEPFEFALAHQFDAFEFFPDRGPANTGGWSEVDLDDTARRAIRHRAANHNLELTVHAPLEFAPLDNPDDPRILRVVQFAQDIGATLLNLHLDPTQGPAAFAQALEPTLRLTAAADLPLALENTVTSSPEDFNRFFAYLRHHPNPHPTPIGMTFDLGHANLFPPLRNDYWRYLDALDPAVPILHLHLHENHGDADRHLPLFTGPSHLDPTGICGLLDRLNTRRFSGCAILEQWPHPPSLLIDARTRLLELTTSPPRIPS